MTEVSNEVVEITVHTADNGAGNDNEISDAGEMKGQPEVEHEDEVKQEAGDEANPLARAPNSAAVLTRTLTTLPASSEGDSQTNVVSFSRDIYNTFIILMAYGNWDKMTPKDQRNFMLMVYGCAALQFSTLSCLLVELVLYPPWTGDDALRDADLQQSDILIITTKMLVLMCFAVYVWREWATSLTIWSGIRHNNKKNSASGFAKEEFNKPNVRKFNHFNFWFSFAITLLAMCLSVGLVSTSSTGFEAVLNTMGIAFVLDIDNWMYDAIKSHRYVEDKLFDIEYEVSRLPTSYWVRVNINTNGMCSSFFQFAYTLRCIQHCVPTVDFGSRSSFVPHAQVSRKCRGFVCTAIVCITASLIFLGSWYNSNTVTNIGLGILITPFALYVVYIIAALVVVTVVFTMMFCCCGWPAFDRDRMDAFYRDDVPRIFEEKYQQELLVTMDDEETESLKQNFVDECVDYAFANGVWFSRARGGIDEARERLKRFIDEKADSNSKESI